VKSSLSPSGIPIVEAASRCTAATSVTAIALLWVASIQQALPPTCLEITHEPGASIVRKNAAALQYRLSSAGLDSFQGCVNLTSIKSNTPLTGKTMPRLANKPFGQAYFCMSLFGSSSAGNEPSWAQYGPELSNQ
jgi:hypothetical protein